MNKFALTDQAVDINDAFNVIDALANNQETDNNENNLGKDQREIYAFLYPDDVT